MWAGSRSRRPRLRCCLAGSWSSWACDLLCAAPEEASRHRPVLARDKRGAPVALPVPNRMYVRPDVSVLEQSGPWDPHVLAYAKAVAEMRSRPDTDPTSWSYQAAIHGTYTTPAQPDWNMCQHASWFFLPWHRQYIFCFEQIVRSVVVSQGGPDDWALPFWNWEANRALPQAFREQQLPDGSPNPIFTTHRASALNAGNLLPAGAVDTRYAFSFADFSSPKQFDQGFGGGAEAPVHFGSLTGALEDQPHNVLHGLIGGSGSGACQGGWMTDPNCAAMDPIFYLHHANVDRLWGRWLHLGRTRVNPTDPAWLNAEFDFFDPGGNPVRGPVSQVVSTRALNYRYSDDPPVVALPKSLVSDRIPGPRPPLPALDKLFPKVPRPAPPPRPGPDPGPMRGGAGPVPVSESKVVELGTAPTTVSLELGDEAVSALKGLREPEGPSLYVTIEDVQADRDPGLAYAVFVNDPDADEDESQFTEHYAGMLSFFGLEHRLHHGGEGAHDHGPPVFVFDVSSLVPQLEDAGKWDPDQVTLTFVPAGLDPASGEGSRIPTYDDPAEVPSTR